MMKRHLTLTLTVAILLSPAAFAQGGQTKASASGKAVAARHAAQRTESARQSFGALPAGSTTNSGDGVAIARPPAQPAQ